MSDRKRSTWRDSKAPNGANGVTEASEPTATLTHVMPETPVFQAYRGTDPPRFANPAELEYAKILERYGVRGSTSRRRSCWSATRRVE